MVTGRGPSAISTGVEPFHPGDLGGMLRGIGQRFGDLFGVSLDLSGRVVRPWPEEATQAVPLGSRHHVYVQVRYRLTHHIVDCHEGALSAQGRDERSGNSLCHRQQWNHEVARQSQQRVHVGSRGDENMALENRTVVKESDHLLITRHHRCVQLTAQDLADHIAHRHETSAIPSPHCRRR